MPLPLPNLDDRKWADLVEEGRSLIPFYAPEWTDHNVHDPGITLIELFAWLAEMDIFQLNRIPDHHRRKFLALAGVYQNPPKPAKTVLSLLLAQGTNYLNLPASVECQGKDPFGKTTRFLTEYPITVSPAKLETIQIFDGTIFQEVRKEGGKWPKFPVFSTVPTPGASVYFGFSEDLSKGGTASLYFKIAGSRKDEKERIRIIDEIKAQRAILNQDSITSCDNDKPKGKKHDLDNEDSVAIKLEHHSVKTVWEFHPEGAGTEEWEQLSAEDGGVFDDTRAFTLDGSVVLKIPQAMQKEQLGKVVKPRYYLRCRFDSGAYDALPVIQNVVMNAVPAVQAVPVGKWKLTIAADVIPSGTPPTKGETIRIRVALDQNGVAQKLSFEPENEELPEMKLLDYQPPDPVNQNAGWIILEVAVSGKGNGCPLQMVKLKEKPVLWQGFRLLSLEKGNKTSEGVWNYVWREWDLRHDLDASSRVDLHYTLEPTKGVVSFGDGEKGYVPPKNSLILANYRTTRAEEGNLSANVVYQLTDSLHNRSLMDFSKVKAEIGQITNPLPAEGGTEAETLIHAEGRVLNVVEKIERAVTLKDIEKLAKQTPGVELARVSAKANVWPELTCLKAPGNVTVVVVPNMAISKPVPSSGLLCAVKSYLACRRIIGMRLNVVGPSFTEVAVNVTVKSFAGIDKTELSSKIDAALNGFLDPLKGGPDKTGWPFGRDVYRAKILQIIDEVEGVDHVQSLELVADGGEPQCGNVSLCATKLVTQGTHEIEVI